MGCCPSAKRLTRKITIDWYYGQGCNRSRRKQNHFSVVANDWLIILTHCQQRNYLGPPLKCFGSIFSILNLLLWSKAPLHLSYNISELGTLKLAYIIDMFSLRQD